MPSTTIPLSPHHQRILSLPVPPLPQLKPPTLLPLPICSIQRYCKPKTIRIEHLVSPQYPATHPTISARPLVSRNASLSTPYQPDSTSNTICDTIKTHRNIASLTTYQIIPNTSSCRCHLAIPVSRQRLQQTTYRPTFPDICSISQHVITLLSTPNASCPCNASTMPYSQ